MQLPYIVPKGAIGSLEDLNHFEPTSSTSTMSLQSLLQICWRRSHSGVWPDAESSKLHLESSHSFDPLNKAETSLKPVDPVEHSEYFGMPNLRASGSAPFPT